MISPQLFEHRFLPIESSTIFLYCDAFCPYFVNAHIGRLLEQLNVKHPDGVKWDDFTVRKAREAFSNYGQIYDKDGFKDPQMRHELACEAANRPDITRAVLNLLPNLVNDENVRDQWLCLLIYMRALPKGTKVPEIDEDLFIDVLLDVLPEVEFDSEWLNSRMPFVRQWICIEVAVFLIYEADPWRSSQLVCDYMESHPLENKYDLYVQYGTIRLLQGKEWRCEGLKEIDDESGDCLDALSLFLRGQYEAAYTIFSVVAQGYSKRNDIKKHLTIFDFFGVIYYLCRFRVKKNLSTFREDCQAMYAEIAESDEQPGYIAIEDLYLFWYDPDHFKRPSYYSPRKTPYGDDVLEQSSLFTRLLYHLVALMAGKFSFWVLEWMALRDRYRDILPVFYNLANDFLIQSWGKPAENLPVAYVSWLDLTKTPKDWERQLFALNQLFRQRRGEKPKRLVWVLDTEDGTVEPYTQVMNKGRWSSGSHLRPSRLLDDDLTYLTDQDREMYAAFVNGDHSYGYSDLYFSPYRGLQILVGHPLIFTSDKREHIELVRREVELKLNEEDDVCIITMPHQPLGDNDFYLANEGNGTWALYIFNHIQQSVSQIIDSGLELPIERFPEFLNLIQTENDLKIRVQSSTKRMEGQSEPLVQLRQDKGNLLAQVRVRPANDDASSTYEPGEGNSRLLMVVNGRPMSITRNLEEETARARELLVSCPVLEGINGHWDWTAKDLEQFFELITELRESAPDLRIEWPEGEKFTYRGTVNKDQISIRTRGGGNWFLLSGEVTVDEKTVLELTDVMEKNAAHGRFVELKNGDFLALTDDVRKSLERLRLFSSKKGAHERSVHPLAGAIVDEVLHDLNHETDKAWQDTVTGMHQAFTLEPEVPAGLNATLRPYQMTGFVWLCRLSAWGVGGCLADDMGLGKTIQAIAVMLREAEKGPCLIIAPTSVCPNWVEELKRFAPSLKVVRLRDADDRKKMVTAMEKGMVMVAGYGLLPREQTLLSEREWQMVVFDEAQALKNNATKRSRAAHAIPAHFHLALTGTPIENHLEDLWSVFDIINPGLLGNLSDFHRRFGSAVEGGPAREALKTLIRPFILRRLKSQVLDDLPELTEQTLIVEPTEKEAAFYESIRRSALNHVHESAEMRSQMRFNILTELTRLRRACCHASLVDPDAAKLVEPVSSKLLRFLELLDEARAGGHRLLVFSQFVGHLSLVRAELDKRGIPYQYLDGATPEEKRREGVAAFQRGEGDAFLISLKAGGQGLNLTAADYVVHLDPWWNPAVEDQATDRAHRIGQKNTVTVYRLVMAHSVEEKILSLHTQKRDLAADFLEGSDVAATSATLSEAELLALLQ